MQKEKSDILADAYNPNDGEVETGSSWDSLTSQPSLLTELRGNERDPISKTQRGTRAQQLRALATLAEGPGSALHPHGSSQRSVTPSLGESDILFWLLQSPGTHMGHTLTYIKANMHMHKIKTNLEKERKVDSS